MPANRPRDLALFTIGINTNLRASDLLRLKVGQVKDLKVGDAVEIKEKKAGKVRQITLNKTCINDLPAIQGPKTPIGFLMSMGAMRAALTI